MALGIAPTPLPPPDVPQIQIPAPKFTDIGKEAAAGVADSSLIGKLWKLLVDFIPSIVSAIIGTLLRWSITISVYIARLIIRGEERAEPAFGQLAATAVEDLFGVSVDPRAVGGRGNRGARTAAAASIGSGILRGLFSGGEVTGGGALQPSKAGAEQFLTTVTQLALEGWLEGWLVEALSVGQLEKFADLDDIMAQVLGLGRLSRRVMGPAAEVLVTTPFEWLMYKAYRPKLLSTGEAVRQVIRGRKDRAWLTEELGRQGYSEERIEALLSAQQKFLDVADLDYLVSHRRWTREQAIQHLRDQGYTAEIASTLLALEEDRRLDGFRRQFAEEASARYVARDIGRDQFQRILQTSGLPERDQRMMDLVAGLRRELRFKQLTAGEVEQAVKRGILTLDEYRAYLLEAPYTLRDAQVLELLLLTEIRTEAEASEARKQLAKIQAEARRQREAELARRREEAARLAEFRGLSLSNIEKLVRAGIRTLEDYRAFLAALDFAPAVIEDLTELLAGELERAEEERALREELRLQAEARQVGLAAIERGVLTGVLTIDDYQQALIDRGVTQENRELLVRLLQADIVRAEEEAARRGQVEADLRLRGISLADMERAVRAGIRTLDSYKAFLGSQGFDADAQDILARLLEREIAADEAARKAREEAARRLVVRGISLDDLERAVRAGIRTIADYRAELTRQGFTLEAQDTLTRLLELQIAQDQAILKAREDARRRLAERDLSLDDLERAVKLGIVSIDIYRAALAREGFDAEESGVLVALLLAGVAEIAAARKRREEAEAALKARRVSLADMESAVRAGVRSIAEYGALLQVEGFTPEAQQTLIALLQVTLDQDRAAALKRLKAEAAFALKRIALGDLEKAVILGIVSKGAYQNALSREGFPLEDQVVLLALLDAEIAKVEAEKRERERAAAALAVKRVSLSQFERGVTAGLRTVPEYRAFLEDQGFEAPSVSLLVGLVERELDQARAAEARRTVVEGDLATRGLSLGQYESAVRNGLRSIDDYGAFLAGEGYGAEDIELLQALLTLKLQPK